jgi:hypothetical protein
LSKILTNINIKVNSPINNFHMFEFNEYVYKDSSVFEYLKEIYFFIVTNNKAFYERSIKKLIILSKKDFEDKIIDYLMETNQLNSPSQY